MSTQTALSSISNAGSQVARAATTALSQAPLPRNVTRSTPQPIAPSPGRFRHPRAAEIAKRRLATSFTTQNIQTAVLNTVVLLATFFASGWAHRVLDPAIKQAQLDTIAIDTSTILNILRLILVSNLYFSLRPVLPYFGAPDEIEDIPLTPSQRALLGLPRSQSNTPGSEKPGNYITPPRFQRSSPSPFTGTPRSGATGRSVSANYSASPLSTSRYTVGFSPTPQQPGTADRRVSDLPFSSPSPLFSRSLVNSASLNEIAQNPDLTESTRSLLDGTTSTTSFASSLRKSHSMRERGGRPQVPGTPSPSAREKSRVKLQPGLNYKWLYEKGLKVGKNGNVEY